MLSNINHTLKLRFSRHVYKAVFKSEHFLSIVCEESLLIAVVALIPKLHLASNSFIDIQLHIIKIMLDFSFIDEPAKPVRVLIVKMIPDEVGMASVALQREGIWCKVCDCYGVGIFSSQLNIFLFQGIISYLFALVFVPTFRPLNGMKILRKSCTLTLKPFRTHCGWTRLMIISLQKQHTEDTPDQMLTILFDGSQDIRRNSLPKNLMPIFPIRNFLNMLHKLILMRKRLRN